MNPISRAGSAPCAIDQACQAVGKLARIFLRRLAPLLVLLALAPGQCALARSGHEVGDWLCSKIFEGGGITLAFGEDGFFAMKIAPQGKSVQHVTGLWRLAPDGVDLTLYTLQDSRMRMSVGKGALYALFGQGSHVTLVPVQKEKASFRITGMLRKGGLPVLTDAGSGREFEVNEDANAADGKFATAEIDMGKGGISKGRIIRHSGVVPRVLEMEGQNYSGGDFAAAATERFWLLPQGLWQDKAAMRFSGSMPESPDAAGSYEVSGPGLRLEGKYRLQGNRLTLIPDPAGLRNLKILGAESLGRAVSGEFAWKLNSRGLELAGEHGRLLLLAP